MVRTIAFASGKGGVGKTSISVNCAITLVRMGYKVALLDADFGMANSHIMMDQKVEYTLQDLLENGKSLDDIICDTPSGVKLIPGGSGVIELLNLDSSRRWEIIKSLSPLEEQLDFLLVDTPAGGSDASIEFASACNNVVVVLVGEPTSFMDAYSFIKAIHMEKNYNRISVLVNLASSSKDAKSSFDSFKSIVTKFLDIQLDYVGWLPNSNVLKNSILARKPVALATTPQDKVLNQGVTQISDAIIQLEPQTSNGVEFFKTQGS
jgi:flagellar biosynthesis protein FlhG